MQSLREEMIDRLMVYRKALMNEEEETLKRYTPEVMLNLICDTIGCLFSCVEVDDEVDDDDEEDDEE